MIKNTRKTYKLIQRDLSQEQLDEERSREETKHPDDDNVVLVRVKRTAEMRNDIEELELEFSKKGLVKRQKLVTENEVLVRNFNASLTLSQNYEN